MFIAFIHSHAHTLCPCSSYRWLKQVSTHLANCCSQATIVCVCLYVCESKTDTKGTWYNFFLAPMVYIEYAKYGGNAVCESLTCTFVLFIRIYTSNMWFVWQRCAQYINTHQQYTYLFGGKKWKNRNRCENISYKTIKWYRSYFVFHLKICVLKNFNRIKSTESRRRVQGKQFFHVANSVWACECVSVCVNSCFVYCVGFYSALTDASRIRNHQ